MIRDAIGWRTDASPTDNFALLEHSLEHAGLNLADSIPLVAPMLGLQVPEEYPALQSTPEHQRKRLLATLVHWIFGFAAPRPTAIILEDLHWVDPSPLEFHEI